MAETENAIEPEGGQIGRWLARFLQWWNGDFDRPPTTAVAAAAPVEAPAALVADPATAKGWPAERIQVTEAFFGAGFATVGGAASALAWIKTLAVNKDSSVVQLGSGLGGMLQTLATEIGAWATGYEANPELAAAATLRAEQAKLGKQAKTICRALHEIERKPRVDCIFAKEAFYLIDDKAGLFRAVDETLKPKGTFAFTDYVLPSAGYDSPLLGAWRRMEREMPHLLDAESWSGMLSAKGYALSMSKDVTKEYMRDMVRDFEAFARRLKETGLDRTLKKWILAETERWLIRFACMERGEIKVYRFLAFKPAEIH
jgi:cyclopropane fatty-acyl-phospholipid synthase-like methyltransferase